jgi:hypothetical protein
MQAVQDAYSGTTFKRTQLQAIQHIIEQNPDRLSFNEVQRGIINAIVVSNGLWTTMSEQVIESCCWLLLNRCLHIFDAHVQFQRQLRQQLVQEQVQHSIASRLASLREAEYLLGNLSTYTTSVALFPAWDQLILTPDGQHQLLATFHRLQEQTHVSLERPIFSNGNASAPLILADLLRLAPQDDPLVWLRTQRLQEVMYCLMDFFLEDIAVTPHAFQSPMVTETLHPNRKAVDRDFAVSVTAIAFHEVGTVMHFDVGFVLPRMPSRLAGQSKQTGLILWDGFETAFDAVGNHYLMQGIQKASVQSRGRKRQEDLVMMCWPPFPPHGTLTLQTAALELSVYEGVTIEETSGMLVAIGQGAPRPPIRIGHALEMAITY